jgi:RsiW-degrading membrane proteinase PrsW (M82 family)
MATLVSDTTPVQPNANSHVHQPETEPDRASLSPVVLAASPVADGTYESTTNQTLTPLGEIVQPPPARPSRSWLGTLGTGLLLWIVSVIVTGLTSSINMIPTVILLGSFLVPATAVIWYLDHYRSNLATPALAARAFIVGGVCGVLAASVLEAVLLGAGPLALFGVGLIEELAKLLGLVLVARSLHRYTVRDGIVLGAAVGFGFAALESSGYALNSLLVREGRTVVLSLGDLVSTEVLRAILSPLGHGLWTALIGAVLFGASQQGRLRISRGVLAMYLFVAILHSLWDAMGPIAGLLTDLSSAASRGGSAVMFGVSLSPEVEQLLIYAAFYFGGLAILSILGIGLLRRRWRSGLPARLQPA